MNKLDFPEYIVYSREEAVLRLNLLHDALEKIDKASNYACYARTEILPMLKNLCSLILVSDNSQIGFFYKSDKIESMNKEKNVLDIYFPFGLRYFREFTKIA